MLTRKEILKGLEGVPKEFVAAFAVRASMRILPLLADISQDDRFWFWKKKQGIHLFSVMHALRVKNYLLDNKKYKKSKTALTAANAARIAYAVHNTAPGPGAIANIVPGIIGGTTITPSAVTSNYALSYAATAIASIEAVEVVDATLTSTNITDINIDVSKSLIVQIEKELSLLTERRTNVLSQFFNKKNVTKSVQEYLQTPLWSTIPAEWQQQWILFRTAVLSVNSGFIEFLNWFEARHSGEPIDFDLLEKQAFLSEEILAQDVSSILAYLDSLDQADKQLNRVRVLFMGHGAAGKTSLVHCLYGEDVIENKEEMTPGIEIREWALPPEKKVQVHIWDFGGQVIAHSTHQFFLRSQCLYVVVLDSRAEINADEQAQYWLEHVKAFAGQAPVLLVGNKADKIRLNLDMNSLRQRYPNIVDYYPLSCVQYKNQYKAEFDRFLRDFILQLQQLDLHQVQFLNAHFNTMQTLREQSRQNAYLSEAKFNSVCEQFGVEINAKLNRQWLLDTLDKLGVIVHFPDFPFHDAYVLNPRWLTYGVYTLLYSKQASESGHLRKSQVFTILQSEQVKDEQGSILTYPKEKCGFIIEAMQRFKLCYVLDDNETMVIPDLLPANKPELDFDGQQSGIHFEFHFPHLLPRQVLPTFIVSRHVEIVNNLVWQRGVLLSNLTIEAKALLTINYSDRVLSMTVVGLDQKTYFDSLHIELLQILDRLQQIRYEEKVALSPFASASNPPLIDHLEMADYRQLLAMLKAGSKEYIASSGMRYDISKLLGSIMTKETLKKETGDTYVINSKNTVVNKGEMYNTAVGNNAQIIPLNNQVDSDLRGLIQAIKVEAEDGDNKIKAIRELELASEELPKAMSGSEADRKSAKQYLKAILEGVKSGTSYTAKVCKDVATISDKLPGLIKNIGELEPVNKTV